MKVSFRYKYFQAFKSFFTLHSSLLFRYLYSEVPNRRADRNKRTGLEKSATLLAYLLNRLLNEQGGIFHLLHKKLQAGSKENLKNLSEHALLLGTSEYLIATVFSSFLSSLINI